MEINNSKSLQSNATVSLFKNNINISPKQFITKSFGSPLQTQLIKPSNFLPEDEVKILKLQQKQKLLNAKLNVNNNL